MDPQQENAFLTKPIGPLLTQTAMPIIFVLLMYGMTTVIDIILVGMYVGADAIGALTCVFPIFMVLLALSTLVGNGMASLVARSLGAQDYERANRVYMSAQILALVISALIIGTFLIFGETVVNRAANGSAALIPNAYSYISIILFFSPFQMLLTANSDALRCEGKVQMMALFSILISLANIAFSYSLIVFANLGVAGAAYGTILAQALALITIFAYRFLGDSRLRLSFKIRYNPIQKWTRIVALGAPQSLGFIGIALVATTIMATLQVLPDQNYDTVVAAYGIITRIFSFIFLPLMAMSQAMQAIVGNNRGAGLTNRALSTLRLSLIVTFLYCLAIEFSLITFPALIGSIFVSDPAVIENVALIMPKMVLLYLLAGPLIILAGYFQAIGNARYAAILSLSKPYLFTIPLVIFLATLFGQDGIWFASPIAEALLFGVAIYVLWHTKILSNHKA